MAKYLRYKDLKESRLVNSREALRKLIEEQGFPPGRLLSPQCRAWTDEEIDAWWETRPVQASPENLRGAAKANSQNVWPEHWKPRGRAHAVGCAETEETA